MAKLEQSFARLRALTPATVRRGAVRPRRPRDRQSEPDFVHASWIVAVSSQGPYILRRFGELVDQYRGGWLRVHRTHSAFVALRVRVPPQLLCSTARTDHRRR